MKKSSDKPERGKTPFIEKGNFKPGEKPSDFVKKPFNILSLEEIRKKTSPPYQA